MISNLKPGDIVLMDFAPVKGREQDGFRPGMVVSTADFNVKEKLVVVVPITRTDRKNPLHVELDSRTVTNGYILVDQMKAVCVRSRGIKFVEKAPSDILDEVKNILALIFDIN